jgi:hypothetical protein
VFQYGAEGRDLTPSAVIVLITMSRIMALEAVKFNLLYKYLHVFTYFLSSFIHIRKLEECGWFHNVKC